MKVAILTALSGISSESKIRDPINNHADVDYFAFVDKKHECVKWKQLPLPMFSLSDDGYIERRNAKLPKILGFLFVPGYDYYIWHDHYLDCVVHPKIIIDNFLKEKQIAVFKHPVRNCVYDEMQATVFHKKEKNLNILETYRNFLLKNNYPRNNGLYELTSFAYRNTPQVSSMMFSWWELICKYSSRDQLSFPYTINKHNIEPAIIPGSPLLYGGHNDYIQEIWDKFS